MSLRSVIIGVIAATVSCLGCKTRVGSGASDQSIDSGIPSTDAHVEAVPVPLVSLLADPNRSNGMRVIVRGFASVGFERDALYPSEADYLNGMDGIFLSIPSDLHSKVESLDGRYVVVVGTFTNQGHGHAGVFVGELTIRNIAPLSNPRCPVAVTGRPDAPCK